MSVCVQGSPVPSNSFVQSPQLAALAQRQGPAAQRQSFAYIPPDSSARHLPQGGSTPQRPVSEVIRHPAGQGENGGVPAAPKPQEGPRMVCVCVCGVCVCV